MKKKNKVRKIPYKHILAQLRITNDDFFAKIERDLKEAKKFFFIQMNEFQYSINSDKKLIPLKMLKRKTFHISKD